jgi:uncharacterized protein (TIGR02145 family)
MNKQEMLSSLREAGILSSFGPEDPITNAEADKLIAACNTDRQFAGENAGLVLLSALWPPSPRLGPVEALINQIQSNATPHRPQPRKLNLFEVHERSALVLNGLITVFDGEVIATALKVIAAQMSDQDRVLLESAKKIRKSAGVYTDPRDGQSYKTIRIGNLEWMAENLNFKTEKVVRILGLISIKVKTSWEYRDNANNQKKFGRLYSWEGAKNSCPPGWRLPTKGDWEGLYRCFGAERKRAYNLAIDGGATGFNALLGGHFVPDRQELTNTNCACFWSGTPDQSSSVWCFGCFSSPKLAWVSSETSRWAYNVRLVRGEPSGNATSTSGPGSWQSQAGGPKGGTLGSP